MKVSAEQLIIQRLCKELEGSRSVALGEGLPQLVKPYLSKQMKVSGLKRPAGESTLDAVVMEALEVSERGDVFLANSNSLRDLGAKRWIVVMSHDRNGEEAKLVAECRLPPTRSQCVDTVITELGVIKITDVGFELREVAPGVAADEVKKRTAASLHVIDGLRVMEL